MQVNGFSLIAIAVAMIIMAVAIVFIIIWVGRLSGQIQTLSDMIDRRERNESRASRRPEFTDIDIDFTPEPMAYEEDTGDLEIPQGRHGRRAGRHASRYSGADQRETNRAQSAREYDENPIRDRSTEVTRASEPERIIGARTTGKIRTARSAQAAEMPSSGRSHVREYMTKSSFEDLGRRSSASRNASVQADGSATTNANAFGETRSAGEPSSFFQGYNQDVSTRREARFGRRGPVIPFGEDKTVVRTKRDYSETAIGFESEPDTVDFKRVAGYRNLNRSR